MIRTELQRVCFCCFISICLWTNFYIWVIWILYAIWYLVSLYLNCQILCKCIINDTSTIKFRPHRIHLVGPSIDPSVRLFICLTVRQRIWSHFSYDVYNIESTEQATGKIWVTGQQLGSYELHLENTFRFCLTNTTCLSILRISLRMMINYA